MVKKILLLFMLLTLTVKGATYYVSPTGSDTANGAQSTPWLTIAHAISTMSSGDTLLLNDGIYHERNTIPTTLNGTQNNVTKFSAIHPLQVTNFGGFRVSQGGNGYVSWNGIVFQDDTNNTDWEGLLQFYHNTSGATYGSGFTISNCWFQGVQDPTAHNIIGINMDTATNAATCSPNFKLLNCVFTNNSQYCVSLMVSNAVISGNRFDFANTHDAMHIWGGQILISNNIFTNISSNPLVSDHTDILQYWSDSPAMECTNVYFCYNYVVNCEAQFFQLELRTDTNYSFGNLGGLYVFNNIFNNVQHHGSIDIPNTRIYNNLFYKCRMTDGTAQMFYIAGPGNVKGESKNSSVLNNIFYDCGSTNPAQYATSGWYDASELGVPTGFVGDYNYAVTESGGFAPKNTAMWTTNGNESHGINGGNPHFAAPEIGDFRSTLGAPQVDTGTNVSSVVSLDFNLFSRPLGAAFDIGPFEYDPSMIIRYNPAQVISNGIMTNLTGYANNGIRMSLTNWPYQTNYSDGAVSKYGSRFSAFSGNYDQGVDLGWGDYVAVTNLSNLQTLTNGTISFWAQYFTTMSNVSTVWDAQLRTQRIFDGGYQGMPWSTGTFFIGRGFSSVTGDANQTVMRLYDTNGANNPTTLLTWPDQTPNGNTTNWHFYTVTWNGTNVSSTNLLAYMDGVLVSSNAMGATFYKITNDFNWFSLGCWSHDGTPQWQDTDIYPNNGWFNGVLGEFRVYNRALAPTEVGLVYNERAASAAGTSVGGGGGGSAPGTLNILSATIEPNGWVMDVTMEGSSTNGTFNTGFTSASSGSGGAMLVGIPTSPSVTLNVTSQGYDSAANPTTLNRTVYGTRVLRYPYGVNGQTQNNYVQSVTNNGDGTITIRVALSDYVYAGDSNITVNITNGWYSAGNKNTTGLSVSNTSTNYAAKVVGNWSSLPFQRITNNTATVSCVAFGPGAQQGKPVKCVQFWAVDEANHVSPTNTVSIPTVDSTKGDAVKVIEYVGNIDCSSLNNSNKLILHFAAYPWIGDTNSVLDTSKSTFTFPSYQCVPSKAFLDRNNTFPVKVAVVDCVNGNDASGQVVDISAFNPLSPPNKFFTLGAASQAIGNTNNTLYNIKDNSAGIIYLMSGSNYIYGTTNFITPSFTVYPRTWLTVQPFPGVSQSQVNITNRGFSGVNFIGNMVHLYNVTLYSTNNTAMIGQTDFLWIDHCLLSSNTTQPSMIDSVTNWYVTQSRIEDIPQGLIATPGRNSNVRLIRGNDMTGMTHDWIPSVFIGNARYGYTNGASKSYWTDTTQMETPSYPIIAFNKLMSENALSGGNIVKFATIGTAMRITNGAAVVQNVIEQVSEDPNAVRTASIGDYSSSSTAMDTNNSDNVYFWNNTGLGQRMNWQENASGDSTHGVAAQRNNSSLLNNLFDNINSKDDIDENPNGARIGNWNIMYGVGSYANVDLDPSIMDGGWHWSWFGINCISNHNWQGTGPTSGWATYAQFTSRQSATLQGTGLVASGNGNYYLMTNSSPLFSVPTQYVLPYDIDGNTRTISDPPGAYSVITPFVPPVILNSYLRGNIMIRGKTTTQ